MRIVWDKWSEMLLSEYMKWDTNYISCFTFDYECPLSEHEGYHVSQCVGKACRLFYCPLAFVQIIAASHNVLRTLGIFLHLFSEVLLVQQNESVSESELPVVQHRNPSKRVSLVCPESGFAAQLLPLESAVSTDHLGVEQ